MRLNLFKLVNLKTIFSGGLDLCFDKQKVFTVELSDKEEIKMKEFIIVLKNKYVKDKPEFFTNNDSL